MDEIGLRLAKQQEIRDCCAHILTETCLHHNTPDQVIMLDAWIVFSADTKQDTGKMRGGRLCVYMSDAWCSNTKFDCVFQMNETTLQQCYTLTFDGEKCVTARGAPTTLLGTLLKDRCSPKHPNLNTFDVKSMVYCSSHKRRTRIIFMEATGIKITTAVTNSCCIYIVK